MNHSIKHNIFYNSFLEEITKKIPQKVSVVNILADILCIGKEAVYRRLRGEVPFTFYEAITISRQLGISLDHLELPNTPMSKPLKLNLIEYINPVKSDFALMDELTTILKSFKDFQDPEAGEITNILPQPLYVSYEHVFRFYLFKWKYHSNKLSPTIPYKDIVILDKLQKSLEEFVYWAKRLHANYIFDHQLFQYIVSNVKYFRSIGLVTCEEVQLIKYDLFRILDEIDYLTRTGAFKETGKKVNIYISNVSIDNNYIYVSAPDFQLTIIKAFLLNGIASTDKSIYEEVRQWVHSMKRQSTLITGSGEKDRICFLEEQHKIIDSLSQL